MEVEEERGDRKEQTSLMSIETFFELPGETAETSSLARPLPPWQPIQRRSASWIYGEAFFKSAFKNKSETS